MNLVVPSRRGFLGGLLAAPFIVQASSLMPISVWNPYLAMEPGSPSDWDWVTREFTRLVHNRMVERGMEIKKPAVIISDTRVMISAFPEGIQQKHIDLMIYDKQFKLSGPEFSKQFLSPAASRISDSFQARRVIMHELDVPSGIMAGANAVRGNAAARGIRDYFIGTDSILTRFDILAEISE